MRLLWITSSLQHPRLAGSARHYYFLREISRQHQVVLLAPTREETPPEVLAELTEWTRDLGLFPFYRKGETGPPNKIIRMLRRYQTLRHMRKCCQSLLKTESFDALVFHGKEIFSVIDFPISVPIISDFCDASSRLLADQAGTSHGWRRLWFYLRYLKMRAAENKLVQKTPLQVFISDRDRRAVTPNVPHACIANGVDLKYWQEQPAQAAGTNLIFTGVMNYEPNLDAALTLCDQILPGLRQAGLSLHLDLVGKNPSRELQQRASEQVRVTGYVPDIRPYLSQAAIFVAPLRFASGMQNKVLEAMAMGVPVVTTASVAEGLQMQIDEKVPVKIADSSPSFVRAITRLLDDQDERIRLAAAAKQFVEKHFDWQQSARHLETMIVNAAGMKSSSADVGIPALAA